MVLQPFLSLGRFFNLLILYTVGRTPWTGDQPVARPQPTHRINEPNTDIKALGGIRTHDPAFERAKTVHSLDRAATVIAILRCIV
jgi:hypothetical protein